MHRTHPECAVGWRASVSRPTVDRCGKQRLSQDNPAVRAGGPGVCTVAPPMAPPAVDQSRLSGRPQPRRPRVARRDRIHFRAKALHEANAAVEVFPLVRPGAAFPMEGFWNGVVHAADDGEGGAAFSDGADTVYRLQARARKLPFARPMRDVLARSMLSYVLISLVLLSLLS